MINFEEFQLKNGLRVIIHQDLSSPFVAVNVLYRVGSKHESPHKTGFAHLFEHLMFAGSANVPNFDIPIQQAGGENNAFTNSDITNFYNIAPHENIDTLLWLEADRMQSLNINEQSLETQKNVVVEEFKEVALNQPYGSLWHHMNKLAYKVHPYRWPTIGLEFSHISEAKIEDVQSFYEKHYHPGNAILAITGNIDYKEIEEKVNHWFGDITKTGITDKQLPVEPKQNEYRKETIHEEVPAEAVYMGFHMGERKSREFYLADLLSDVLSNGRSSRFFTELYKKENIFNTIDAYIVGAENPGLFMIEMKLKPEADVEVAKSLVWDQLDRLKHELVSDFELKKLLNKIESAYLFGEINVLHKAINLAYFAHLNATDSINKQVDIYHSITANELKDYANILFSKSNCSELHYAMNKK